MGGSGAGRKSVLLDGLGRRNRWTLMRSCGCLAQEHCGVHPAEPKTRVDRLGEGGVEGVELRQCATGDHEEGQRSR